MNSKAAYDLLPSYQKILRGKNKSYPANITVDESHTEIQLQNLLDHTATRVLELQKDVVNNIEDTSVNNLMLIRKWGFDGSTGHAVYKQAVR